MTHTAIAILFRVSRFLEQLDLLRNISLSFKAYTWYFKLFFFHCQEIK